MRCAGVFSSDGELLHRLVGHGDKVKTSAPGALKNGNGIDGGVVFTVAIDGDMLCSEYAAVHTIESTSALMRLTVSPTLAPVAVKSTRIACARAGRGSGARVTLRSCERGALRDA